MAAMGQGSDPDRSGHQRRRFGRSRWALAAVLICLLAGSCTSSGDDADEPTATTTGAADQTATAEGNPFVQDLWIYDQLRTVDGQAEIVDHTLPIVEHVKSASNRGEPVDLIEGMTFTPAPDVNVVIHDADGEVRPDVTAIAGVVDNEFGTAFAVLGTVASDGDDQIRAEDRVFVDMSFLGDTIEPGDLAAADFMLVQLLPTGEPAETDLSPMDLFAHRAAAEEILYSADEHGDPVVYGNELGRIIEGSMGPEIPPKAQPMLSGFKDGIKKCWSKPGLTCVPDYMAKFGKGATDSLGQIDKQLPIKPPPNVIPPPKEYRPPYIPPTRPRDREPLACQNGGCGRAAGDPHLRTFDGHRYGMQAVGELVLAQHAEDELELQIRTSGRPSGLVSWVDVVAVGVGDQRVQVGQGQVLLDGEPVSTDDLTLGVAGDGFELTRTYVTTTIVTDEGHVITMEQRSPELIDVVISPAEDTTGWTGLLGDRDGRSANDLVARDGTAYAPGLTFEELYQGLAMSWRVTDETSLFTYADGETTADFTDLSYPAAPLTLADLPSDEVRQAEAACRLAGITEPEVLEDCTLDFAVTGDIAFLLSARLADAIDGILSGRLAPDGSPRADDDAGENETPEPADRSWYLSGAVLGDEDAVEVTCPPPNGNYGLRFVIGDNPYHVVSGVCRAAVHAGVIDDDGGVVLVSRAPDQASFPSVERHGMTSDENTAGGEAFTVSAP